MKVKTVYEADDGRKFDDEFECFEHEQWCNRIKAAVCLPEIPHLDNMHYYQHSIEDVRTTRRRLFKLYLERYGDSFPEHKKLDPDKVHPSSAVGRVLDDASGPLGRAWDRLTCINMDTGREYNQPYFVQHPQEAPDAVN